MSDYTIRPLEGEDDYSFGVELFNACFSEYTDLNYNIYQLRDWWKVGDDPVREVYIVEVDEQPLAALRFTQFPGEEGKLRFYCNVNIMPDDYSFSLLRELFMEMLERVTEHKPDELRMSLFGHQEEYMALVEAQGFKRIQRDQLSSLVLSNLDFDSFADIVQHVKESGIRLVTLAEYKQENRQYKTALVELNNAIYEDVPGFESTVTTLEQFETRVLQNKDVLDDTWILAMDDEQLVGMTYNARFGNDEDCLTQLTGVIRSHRRRGITTAMKLRSFVILRDMGFKRILTGNEENNPMYQINLKLGFRPGPAMFLYTKQLSGER